MMRGDSDLAILVLMTLAYPVVWPLRLAEAIFERNNIAVAAPLLLTRLGALIVYLATAALFAAWSDDRLELLVAFPMMGVLLLSLLYWVACMVGGYRRDPGGPEDLV